MDIEPPTREQHPAGVPPCGPTRVLRATPSAETLRETGWAHVVIGCAALLLSFPFVIAALAVWEQEIQGGLRPRLRGRLAVTGLAVALAGYGIYRIVRGVRMVLVARHLRDAPSA